MLFISCSGYRRIIYLFNYFKIFDSSFAKIQRARRINGEGFTRIKTIPTSLIYRVLCAHAFVDFRNLPDARQVSSMSVRVSFSPLGLHLYSFSRYSDQSCAQTPSLRCTSSSFLIFRLKELTSEKLHSFWGVSGVVYGFLSVRLSRTALKAVLKAQNSAHLSALSWRSCWW